jgi:hypothetical protein
MKERAKALVSKNKNELSAARTLYVSLDNTGNVIEGADYVCEAPNSSTWTATNPILITMAGYQNPAEDESRSFKKLGSQMSTVLSFRDLRPTGKRGSGDDNKFC